jgi:hypothetical protein
MNIIGQRLFNPWDLGIYGNENFTICLLLLECHYCIHVQFRKGRQNTR